MRKRITPQVVFLVALLLAAVSFAAWPSGPNETKTAYMGVTDAGDTAQVYTVYGFSALDSFPYRDTIKGTWLSSADSVVTWTSPLYKMVLTPLATDSVYDSAVFYDTLIFPSTARLGVKWVAPLFAYDMTPNAHNSYAYTDTIVLTDTFVVTWTSPSSGTDVAMVCDSMVAYINAAANLSDSVAASDGTTKYVVTSKFSEANLADWYPIPDTATDSSLAVQSTLAMWCDSIAALIEAEANLTDSVKAEDSATYVLVTSLFGSDVYEGRWTVKTTSNQDTASHAGVTTVAMVADSLSAAINAADSISNYVTAANSGDTAFTITADQKGWAYTLTVGDTAQDTVHTQNNVTSWSSNQDTIFLTSLIFGERRATGILAEFTMNASADTAGGFGATDSCVLWLYTEFDSTLYLLDSTVADSLPVTLRLAIGSDTTGGGVDPDTLFKSSLWLVYKVKDSTSDTSFNTSYQIDCDYLLFD